ncbi:hypothetical protein ACFV2Q_27645 [Streptomyces sp. NPDC059650]|uniref:hypothetical protein n=1 Tax=Streptomyces sp. NPDC059650 TaxID=3346896 RepID=UPI003684C253
MIHSLAHWPRDSHERHPAELALLDQWPPARLGPELAAVAEAAQTEYRTLLAFRLRRSAAERIRTGLLAVEEWPAQYGHYDPKADYDQLCETHLQRHQGMRAALLAALRARPDTPQDQAERILLSVALSRDPAASPDFM